MGHYETLAALPITVERYELEGGDREFGTFTRPSTIIHLHGAGQEGLGEDVVYDVLDQIAHRDRGTIHDLTGPTNLGEFCELVSSLDFFGGEPPLMEASAHYRRWAYESAALDLALRQSETSLHEALGLEPQPVSFVCSTRLGSFGERRRRLQHRAAAQAARPSTQASVSSSTRKRLDAGADRRDLRARRRRRARPQRPLPGHPRRCRHRPRALRRPPPRPSRRPTSRTPTSTTRPAPVLEPHMRPRHLGRQPALAR